MNGGGELYLQILNRIIGPTEDKTLLDLCCGAMMHTRLMKFRESLHIDVRDWPERPREFGFICADVRNITLNRTYDVALCSDGIEHLSKKDGLELLDNMERWSKLPIIFTPLGEQRIVPGSTDPDDHKSGWTPEEFTARGWLTEVYPTWHVGEGGWGCGAFFAWRPQ